MFPEISISPGGDQDSQEAYEVWRYPLAPKSPIVQYYTPIQQQAAAAWFVFSVGMFGVWFGAGHWHVLGLRIGGATHGASSALCGRFGCPSHRLVATTPSPLDVITAFSTQCASATPRVDVDAVMTGLGEILWLENMESHEGKNEKEEEEGKECLKEKKDPGCFPVFIRSLTGCTVQLLISPHADVLTLLSMVEGLVHIPRHHWYVRANGKPLPDLSMPHGLLRDEWQVARSSCFRCGCLRKDSEAMNTPRVVPPRERQFLGRAPPAQARSSVCPRERRPSPQGVRKPTGGNDKGAVARMVLEALSSLNLDGEILNKIRAQLDPPPPAPKPSRILADLEVKIDKAQNDLARLQKVVVTKQAELHQADERANCKAKEVRELHAEMMRVKREVLQVAPPSPPPTPRRWLFWLKKKGVVMMATSPLWPEMMMLSWAFTMVPLRYKTWRLRMMGCLKMIVWRRSNVLRPPHVSRLSRPVNSLVLDITLQTNWLRLRKLRLCVRTACLRERWGNSFDPGVQEDSQDSWTVVTNKKKSLKIPLFKKDAVFEATNKLKEKKDSLCCFGQVPQGTKMPLFQVPSSSVSDVFYW